MSNKITLAYFQDSEQFYHVYKTDSSRVSEELHYHDYYQICFVGRGKILHKQEGDGVKLIRGDAFIVPPGFVHSVHFVGENTELYSLSFRQELFYSGFTSSAAYKFLTSISLYAKDQEKLAVRLRVRLNDNQRASVEALFECLIREFAVKWTRDLTASGSIVAAIMLILAQEYYSGATDETTYRQSRNYHESIEKCVKYIDQNFMYSINMPLLLKRFAISRSSFSMLFPRYTGTTLNQYINEKRIEQAQKLAKCNTLPLSEISAMVGYGDFSTFYRNFIKIVGISPMKYRSESLPYIGNEKISK